MVDTSDTFFDEARQIITLAMGEARRLKHDYLGAEHILLALTTDRNSRVATALSDVGLTPGKLKAAIDFVIGEGDHDTKKVSLNPQAIRVIELALDEAHRLNSDHCGSEHLLLGILSEGNNVAAGILDSIAGRELNRVRNSLSGLSMPNETREIARLVTEIHPQFDKESGKKKIVRNVTALARLVLLMAPWEGPPLSRAFGIKWGMVKPLLSGKTSIIWM